MSLAQYAAFRGREDKLLEVNRLFSRYLQGDVLDVGCDAKYLSTLVQGRYVGVDMSGAPDVKVNVEAGLPFYDKSFDSVTAFDILEHCDRIHFVFDELCRVSRAYVLIGLPNMYEWSFRLSFVLGKKLSGKYGLPADPPLDRHRWLYDLDDARTFVRQRGTQNGFTLVEEAFAYYLYRRLLGRLITAVGRLLAPRAASVCIYHHWAVLKRDS